MDLYLWLDFRALKGTRYPSNMQPSNFRILTSKNEMSFIAFYLMKKIIEKTSVIKDYQQTGWNSVNKIAPSKSYIKQTQS